jgi:hypothetical protein
VEEELNNIFYSAAMREHCPSMYKVMDNDRNQTIGLGLRSRLLGEGKMVDQSIDVYEQIHI